MIDKNPGGRKVYEVDVRKLALLSKRGGDAISDLYDAEKQFLRKTANERKKAIQRRTAEDRYIRPGTRRSRNLILARKYRRSANV